jgi:hypothetical protein
MHETLLKAGKINKRNKRKRKKIVLFLNKAPKFAKQLQEQQLREK